MVPVKSFSTVFLIFLNILLLLTEGSSHYTERCYYELHDSGIVDVFGILALHNYCRDLVLHGKVPGQPAAQSMKEMVWDQRLAHQALEVAEKCLFKHDRAADDRFVTGQNIHIDCSNHDHLKTNWTEALRSWFNEHKHYKYPHTKHHDLGVAGHYTQLVWADTEYVGCAYSSFKVGLSYDAPEDDFTQKMARLGMDYCKLYVCNYGPGGNIIGGTPYKAT